jgi:glycosyltransferase involved in cell wall biosynthesis
LRIALVVSGGLDQSGRVRVTPSLLWLTERLAARVDLHAYVLRYHDRPVTYQLRGATVHDLGSPAGVGRQYAALVDAMRRDGPFAVVHAYMGHPPGLVAALAGWRLRIPVVVTLDSGEFVAFPDIGYGLQLHARHRWSMGAVARLATHLTVCSHFQEHLARRHRLVPSVIPLGIDPRQFAPDPGRQEGPPWRLVHVASLNPVKDQTTLLRAFEQLVRSGRDVHLDIVGEDTVGGAVHKAAHQLGVRHRVTFHGFQPTDALVALYQRSHLCVLSSRHEAANVSVLEAAACGVAAVGTHVGYLADWTPARAVTVPTQDPHALARAIESLLRDPKKRDSLAAAAEAWTRSHDADWSTDQFANLYKRAATTGQPR